jgi:hypothetical protein
MDKLYGFEIKPDFLAKLERIKIKIWNSRNQENFALPL